MEHRESCKGYEMKDRRSQDFCAKISGALETKLKFLTFQIQNL